MNSALIIPGLPRCATTSLVNILGQHPDLTTGVQKEPHYFIPEDLKKSLFAYEKHGCKRPFSKLGMCFDLDSYTSNYSSLNGCWVDGSTLYSTHPESIDEIKKYSFSKVKFVVMFRRSFDRGWSHYKFSTSRGEEYRTFEKAVSEELGGLDLNWLLGGYIRAGKIAPVVNNIISNFGVDSLYIVNLDETDITSDVFLKELTTFIGLKSFHYNLDVYKNASEDLKYTWLKSFRVFLRRARQLSPIFFDNTLTRWFFYKFMSLAPKGNTTITPTLPNSMLEEFALVDHENEEIYQIWHSWRSGR